MRGRPRRSGLRSHRLPGRMQRSPGRRCGRVRGRMRRSRGRRDRSVESRPHRSPKQRGVRMLGQTGRSRGALNPGRRKRSPEWAGTGQPALTDRTPKYRRLAPDDPESSTNDGRMSSTSGAGQASGTAMQPRRGHSDGHGADGQPGPRPADAGDKHLDNSDGVAWKAPRLKALRAGTMTAAGTPPRTRTSHTTASRTALARAATERSIHRGRTRPTQPACREADPVLSTRRRRRRTSPATGTMTDCALYLSPHRATTPTSSPAARTATVKPSLPLRSPGSRAASAASLGPTGSHARVNSSWARSNRLGCSVHHGAVSVQQLGASVQTGRYLGPATAPLGPRGSVARSSKPRICSNGARVMALRTRHSGPTRGVSGSQAGGSVHAAASRARERPVSVQLTEARSTLSTLGLAVGLSGPTRPDLGPAGRVFGPLAENRGLPAECSGSVRSRWSRNPRLRIGPRLSHDTWREFLDRCSRLQTERGCVLHALTRSTKRGAAAAPSGRPDASRRNDSGARAPDLSSTAGPRRAREA